MEAYTIYVYHRSIHLLTDWLTGSLTHLSAYLSCIPFEACPQVPGLFVWSKEKKSMAGVGVPGP